MSAILLSTVILTNPAEDFFNPSTTGFIRHVPRSIFRYRPGTSWTQAAESGCYLSPLVSFRCNGYEPGCWVKTEQLSFRMGPSVPCFDVRLRWCTVCHIKRELVKIQVVILPTTAWKFTWGSKESTQVKGNVNFMTTVVDLFSVKTECF
jgi:hypothetical protein